MSKVAMVTGASGQDASYLMEHLLAKGYEVHGIVRRSSSPEYHTKRIDHIFDPESRTNIHYGDLNEGFDDIILKIKPNYIYNLAAQSIHKDSLCPIMSAQNIEYRTIEDLFKEQLKKGKKIRVEKIDGNEVEVIDLPNSKQLRALSIWNNKGTWFPIKQLIRHKYKGKMIELSQKFGNICVTPNHSVYDINYNLCKPQDNPDLLNVRSLNYRRKISNSITLRMKATKNGSYSYLFQKGNLGKVKTMLKDKDLNSFCRFAGAFISEGWTVYNKINDSYHICISNNNKKWLENLEKDIKKFYKGTICYVKDKKGCWRIELKSKLLYKICRKLFGVDSNSKQLPVWFSRLSDENLMFLWEKLREGDGSNLKRGNQALWRYGTSSYKLACQLGFLFSILKIEYTQYKDYNDDNEKWHEVWVLTNCESYQPNQGSKKIKEIDYDDYVYDIEVAETHNFVMGVGNIVVHNSHVWVSFKQPLYTAEVNAIGVLRLLESVRRSEQIFGKQIRVYQASSSELWGITPPIQNEESLMQPQSPYGVAKLFAYWSIKNYRTGYNMFASNGILHNHSSPRRGVNFASRKITRTAARIALGMTNEIQLGNIDAIRDEGHSSDYTKAMILILEHSKPDDFVVATGEGHTIREFAEKVFKHFNLDLYKYLKINDSLKRANEVPALVGDATKIRTQLGWKPEHTFESLIEDMCMNDYYIALQELKEKK